MKSEPNTFIVANLVKQVYNWELRMFGSLWILKIQWGISNISINYSFKFSDYGRHSKSIDTSKKRCGRCRGQLELLVASKIGGKYKKSDAHNSNHKDSNNLLRTPKAPNAFAMFVKENYKTFRTPGTTHKNAMEALSLQFSQTKISKD